MQSVLTLVSGKNVKIMPEHVRQAQDILADFPTGDVDWLCPDQAVDLTFDGPATRTLENQLRTKLGAAKLDVFIQPCKGRRKSLLVADMDSTIIQQESLDELAAEVGLRDKVSMITERGMRGELDFVQSLTERVALLKGMSVLKIDKAIPRLTDTPGAGRLISTMTAHNARCVLVSGGFEVFAKPVAERLGFDAVFSNVLEVKAEKLTGKVIQPVMDSAGKYDILCQQAKACNVSLEDALVVGDGANDLMMIKAAGAGVAFHAKPAVQDIARYKINSADLSALLFMQGYRMKEISG